MEKIAGKKFSDMAERLEGSEILRLANKVRELNASGRQIANYTVGDFMPGEFRIPEFMEKSVIKHYQNGQTNYPPSMGMPELKKALCTYLKHFHNLEYAPQETLVSSGARPVIYLAYAALVNPGEKAIFPVPSWNNNHYCRLLGISPVALEVSPEENFLPTAETIRPHLKDAYLMVLTSPSNPTGTLFSREALQGICDAVLEENLHRQNTGQRPLYLLYDQMYCMLTFGRDHFIPTQLRPELRPWLIIADGASKWLAGTGIRVGWAYGPAEVIDIMGNMLAHVGAWAPKPEQLAVAELLSSPEETLKAILPLKEKLQHRLQKVYQAIADMQADGLPIMAIEPQGAMYLSVRLMVQGKSSPGGRRLNTNDEIADWLLEEGSVALVPFQAFSVAADNGWFRLSVGGVTDADIDRSLISIRTLLSSL